MADHLESTPVDDLSARSAEQYASRLLIPLLFVFGLVYLLPNKLFQFRVAVYILLFVFARDLMTPLGLWFIDTQTGFIRLCFTNDTSVLFCIGLACVTAVIIMNHFRDSKLNSLLVWWNDSRGSRQIRQIHFWKVLLLGVVGICAIVLPALQFSRISSHAVHDVAPHCTFAGFLARHDLHYTLTLLLFCLMGNMYEEVLFRGYLFAIFEKYTGQSPWRAALLTAISFSMCHCMLAYTVTDNGFPLMLLTLWEGLVLGVLRIKYGVLCTSFAHGMSIFLITVKTCC